jgi:hypothetical protein
MFWRHPAGTAAANGAFGMSDKTAEPQTLESIAASIEALRNALEDRIAETKSQLGLKIETLGKRVAHGFDAVIAIERRKSRP